MFIITTTWNNVSDLSNNRVEKWLCCGHWEEETGALLEHESAHWSCQKRGFQKRKGELQRVGARLQMFVLKINLQACVCLRTWPYSNESCVVLQSSWSVSVKLGNRCPLGLIYSLPPELPATQGRGSTFFSMVGNSIIYSHQILLHVCILSPFWIADSILHNYRQIRPGLARLPSKHNSLSDLKPCSPVWYRDRSTKWVPFVSLWYFK